MSEEKQTKVQSKPSEDKPKQPASSLFFACMIFVCLTALVFVSHLYSVTKGNFGLQWPITFLGLAILNFYLYKSSRKRYQQRLRYEAYIKKKKQEQNSGQIQKQPDLKEKTQPTSTSLSKSQTNLSKIKSKPQKVAKTSPQSQAVPESKSERSLPMKKKGQTNAHLATKAKTVLERKAKIATPITQEIPVQNRPQSVAHQQPQPSARQQQLRRISQIQATSQNSLAKRKSTALTSKKAAKPEVFDINAQDSSGVFDAEKGLSDEKRNSQKHNQATHEQTIKQDVSVESQKTSADQKNIKANATQSSTSPAQSQKPKYKTKYEEGEGWTPVALPRPLYMDREPVSAIDEKELARFEEQEIFEAQENMKQAATLAEAEAQALAERENEIKNLGYNEESSAQNVTNLNEVLERRRRAL